MNRDIKGKASRYAGKYSRSRDSLVGKMRAAGLYVAFIKGVNDKHIAVVSPTTQADTTAVPSHAAVSDAYQADQNITEALRMASSHAVKSSAVTSGAAGRGAENVVTVDDGPRGRKGPCGRRGAGACHSSVMAASACCGLSNSVAQVVAPNARRMALRPRSYALRILSRHS